MTISSAREDVDQQRPSNIAGGNAKGYSHFEKQSVIKLNINLPYDPATPCPSISPSVFNRIL